MSTTVTTYPNMGASEMVSVVLGTQGQGLILNKEVFNAIRWMNGFRLDIEFIASFWQLGFRSELLNAFQKTSDRRAFMKTLIPKVKKWLYTSISTKFMWLIFEYNTADWNENNHFVQVFRQCYKDILEDSQEIGGLTNNIILNGRMHKDKVFTFLTLTDSIPDLEVSLQDYRGDWRNDQYIDKIVKLIHVERMFPGAFVPVFSLNMNWNMYDKGEVNEQTQSVFESLKTLPPKTFDVRMRITEKQEVGGPHLLLREPYFMLDYNVRDFKVYPVEADTQQNISWIKFQGDDESLWFRQDITVTITSASPF